MAKAEFEEREFETALYNQLQVYNRRVWAPGQVLEGQIGFDYSAFVEDQYFWSSFGFADPLKGFLIDKMITRKVWSHRKGGGHFPNFSLNLFIQAKRPTHLQRVAKKLAAKNLSSPYWRFDIEVHQQELLERLASECKGMALVCYASPAFQRLTQLYAHTEGGSIVANSTFPEIVALKSHSAWNYDRGGAMGVANVDPVYIERSDIDTRIEKLVSQFTDQSEDGFRENLASLARIVTIAVEDTRSVPRERRAHFFQLLNSVENRTASDEEQQNPVRDFLVVRAFIKTFNLKWFVMGKERYA